MVRALLAFVTILVFLNACTQRTICPAFQSAYIHDRDQLHKKFSYFKADSTPKIYAVNKTKYLIAEPVSYRKKIRSMQTVPMMPVNVVVPDSLDEKKKKQMLEEGEDGVIPGSELDLAARSVLDSTFIVDEPVDDEAAPLEDSVYVISKDREVRFLKYDFPDSLILDSATGRYVPEKPRYAVVNITFNVEQDNYMWYLREYLVLPDVKLARNQQNAKKDDEGKEAKKKKGGFFKNLFRKKDRKKDQMEEDAKPAGPKTDEEEFDFIDDNEVADAPSDSTASPEKKNGLFGRKKKSAQPASEPQEKPKRKKDRKQPDAPPATPVTDPEEKKLPEKLDEDGF